MNIEQIKRFLWHRSPLIGAIAVALLISILWQSGESSQWHPEQWLDRAADYSADIRWDNNQTPHISGERDVDVAFGVGWTHANKRYQELLTGLRFIQGKNGLEQGRAGLDSDWLVAFLQLKEMATDDWQSDTLLSSEVRDYIEAYTVGINAFIAYHPESENDAIFPVTPQDVLALLRWRTYAQYGLHHKLTELSDREFATNWDSGGTAIAVTPTKGWGNTFLLFSPQLPVSGMQAPIEMHLKSDEGLNISGITQVGVPFVMSGFNENIGWATTSNRPLLTRMYELSTSPTDRNLYELDGLWRNVQTREVKLKYRPVSFMPFIWSESVSFESTEHGPVFREVPQSDKITEDSDQEETLSDIALHYPGLLSGGYAEQWYRLNKAQDFASWKQAMELHLLPSQNFVYVDRNGVSYFVYNAHLNRNDEELDWTAFAQGNDSRLIQIPKVRFTKLPQVTSPSSGFIISTDQGPKNVTWGLYRPGANTPKAWGINFDENNRSLRGGELLNRPGGITAEILWNIKKDNSYSRRWLPVADFERLIRLPINDASLRATQAVLAEWDLTVTTDSQGAALGECMLNHIHAKQKTAPTNATGQSVLSDSELSEILSVCHIRLVAQTGNYNPNYGEVNFYAIGDSRHPVDGGAGTLKRTVNFLNSAVVEEAADGITFGDSIVYLIQWDRDGKIRPFISKFLPHSSSIEEDFERESSITINQHFFSDELTETYITQSEIRKNTDWVVRIPN